MCVDQVVNAGKKGVAVYDKFEALDEGKRERILNAAMDEFSAKGYGHASTNAIVERAGIAKGLLFHYFKSKKHLFLYLYDYALRRVVEEVYASPALQETDFFEKMRMGQVAKMALLQRYPELFAFTRTAYLEESPAIRAEVEKKNQQLIESTTQKYFGNIDYSKFKEGLDVPRAINAVFWSLEGYTTQYLRDLRQRQTEFDFAMAMEDAQKYLKLFQDCFYREA